MKLSLMRGSMVSKHMPLTMDFRQWISPSLGSFFTLMFWLILDSWKLLLPTPLEVYHDEEGVRVELLMTSQDTLLMNKVCGFPYPLMSPLQDICTLVWYGPSGKTVKTSLLPKFNDLIYKVCHKTVGHINIQFINYKTLLHQSECGYQKDYNPFEKKDCFISY